MSSHFTELIPKFRRGIMDSGTLYISGYKAAANPTKLAEYEIKLVVSMMQIDNSKLKRYITLTKGELEEVVDFSVEDLESSDISKYFYETTNLIARYLFTGKNVLIHCESGYSRAPTIAIAFKMRFWYQTFDEVFKEFSKMDARISPNFGFRMQLKEYEKFLKIAEKKEAKKNPEALQEKLMRIKSSLQPKVINSQVAY